MRRRANGDHGRRCVGIANAHRTEPAQARRGGPWSAHVRSRSRRASFESRAPYARRRVVTPARTEVRWAPRPLRTAERPAADRAREPLGLVDDADGDASVARVLEGAAGDGEEVLEDLDALGAVRGAADPHGH